MIKLFVQQTSCKVNEQLIQDTANKMLDFLGFATFDVAIVLCEKDFIQNLNKTYRDKDYPTDILSFPIYPELTPESALNPDQFELKDLGDLIVCPSQIQEDALELGQTFEARMKKILAHGLCHLLGYTHYTEEEHQKMLPLEERLLNL